jgi:16S rRNA (uracil1498-N3)-methyltransferase
MRIPRIYISGKLQINTSIDLDTSASHHIAKVLRMKMGGALTLFNGDGFEYTATIEAINKKSLTVSIHQALATHTESPLAIHLGIAISRGERMDHVMQKATELGVTEITPLFTERTEVKLKGDREQKKLQHWRRIIVGACEQSGRTKLPTLNPPQELSIWLSKTSADKKLVLHHRNSNALESTATPESIALLVGPEGGLSEQEICDAEAQSFQSLRMGPRVLRTETAPLAALSLLQFVWGDFK